MSKISAKLVMLISLALLICSSVMAQPEVIIGEIEMSSMSWGPQRALFEVQNQADFEKILSVRTLIAFDGIYMSPTRSVRTNYFLAPHETRMIDQLVIIPGNYGKAEMVIEVFDVVDTLDAVMDYQRIFQQPYKLNYHIPDELLDYFQEEIVLPPMVSNSLDFDTEFIRLFILLFDEGKSLQEIADLARTDIDFVNYIVGVMVKKGYLAQTNAGPVLSFSVIKLAEAKEGRALAEETADKLTALVEKNMPGFRAHLKNLAEQGIMPADADNFMHPGSVLYYTFPTVSGLFFWLDLGQKFINPGGQLAIYENTDLCRALIPKYMYAVQGGPYFNGTTFYHAEMIPNRLQITFSDSIPGIECIPGFEVIPKLYPEIHWRWSSSKAPEPFVLDTAMVTVGLAGLREGADQLLGEARQRLEALAVKHGHDEHTMGARLWFWNLVASRATRKLIEKEIIFRRSDGFLSFEQI